MISKPISVVVVSTLSFTLAAFRGAPTAASNSEPAFASSLAQSQGAVTRFAVASTGNEVAYRVQERITLVDIPNYEAVGKTQKVSGAIVFDPSGRVVAGQSKIIIDVTELKSDQERRDGYVQRRLLETEKYPTVEFTPTGVRGLTGPLPTSGTRTFQLTGNMTVRGVTKPTTWDVTAQFNQGTVTGLAATQFTFADFELTKPSVSVILTLADEFKLEYRFRLIRST